MFEPDIFFDRTASAGRTAKILSGQRSGEQPETDNPRCLEPVRIDRDLFEKPRWGDYILIHWTWNFDLITACPQSWNQSQSRSELLKKKPVRKID
jgi:hypothetical protein